MSILLFIGLRVVVTTPSFKIITVTQYMLNGIIKQFTKGSPTHNANVGRGIFMPLNYEKYTQRIRNAVVLCTIHTEKFWLKLFCIFMSKSESVFQFITYICGAFYR